MDSLKLKGSLYGHKLPVLAMDISSDGTLLVTASADKNIKVWGLDFNDCHKSIFAHQDSVMQVSTSAYFKHDYVCHHSQIVSLYYRRAGVSQLPFQGQMQT